MLKSTPSFFALFLTKRQLLTRRSILVLVALAAVPSVWLVSQMADSVDATDTSQHEPQAASRLLTVSTQKLSSAGPSHLEQVFTGIVTPRRASMLASKAVARVESVYVDIGDRVETGQMLLQLDVNQLTAARRVAVANIQSAKARLDELVRGPRQQDIEQAEAQVEELTANLKLSKNNLNRITDLRNSSSVSRQEYEESLFNLDAMQAKLDSAQQKLALLLEGTRKEQIDAQTAIVESLQSELQRIDADIADRSIVAPFSGTIQGRQIDEGAVVSPGQGLLEIIEAAPYEVRVGLPPELARIVDVDTLHVKNEQQSLDFEIDRIAPAINEVSRTREVVLMLNQTSSHLVSIGAAVRIELQIPVESSGGYWVPSTCLTTAPRGLWAVYVAADSTAADEFAASPEIESTLKSKDRTVSGDHVRRIERRQVELLRAQGQWSEIRGPLSPDDDLVMTGVHRITPGQIVTLSNDSSIDLARHE